MLQSQIRIARSVLRVPFLFALLLLALFLGELSRSAALEPCSGLIFDTAYAQETPRPSGELAVFAAASLTEPFTEMGKRLEMSYPGLKIVYNFGGSQALRTQLEQGAHADIFASADGVQMEQAKQSGVVQGETPIFVKNRLVVITPKANPGKVTAFRDLAKPGLKLDLANAKVPVGHYSHQAFTKASAEYGADFEKSVLGNIVSEEENVKQEVTKVQLGEADASIVYVSDVTPKVSKDVLTVAIPDAYNQLATYPIALTKGVQNPAAAAVFISFVLSAEGQAIFKAHNFIPVKE
jgi:molybdate transport system substrate-binding protein